MPGPRADQVNQNLGAECGLLCYVKAPQPQLIVVLREGHASLLSAVALAVAFLLSGENVRLK